MNALNSKAVVTLICEGFAADYELPVSIPIAELSDRLLLVLQNEAPKVFAKCKKLWFGSEYGVFLNEKASLNDYGVCAGSKIRLICEG